MTFVAGMVASLVIALNAGQVRAAEAVYGPLIGLFTLLAVGFAVRAAVHPALDVRTRQAWRWIGGSYLLLVVAVVLFNTIPMVEFPRLGDFFKLAMIPVLLVGLVRLPMRPMSGEQRRRLLLDAGTVAAAAGLFVWYLLISPVIGSEHVTVQRVVAATAYPLTDVVVIFVVAMVLMRGVNSSVRRTMQLMVAAMVCWVAGDTIMSHRVIEPNAPVTVGWEIFVLATAHFLLCAATVEQVRVASTGWDIDKYATQVNRVSKLPYGGIVAAFIVLTVAAVQRPFQVLWVGLVFCMALLNGCVVARQLLAQRENFRMAITDGLTGLTNRAGLNDALSLELVRSSRSGTTTAVLLADLDGFKQVNDSLGHEAGDKLLVCFGAALRRSVLGNDLVTRLGGDEFAVVLHDVGSRENVEAVIRRIQTELETPVMIGDRLIQIRSSVGMALCGPGDEMTLDQIMHQADLDMYEVKRARKAKKAVQEFQDAAPA